MNFISGEMKKFLEIGGKISQYFPETAKRIIIINAPAMFGIFWKIAKIFLDKTTIEKVSIHSNDTLNVLKKFIPIENIPYWYGGNCREELINNPGPWKEELKLSKEKNYLMCRNRQLYDKFFLFSEEKNLNSNLKEEKEEFIPPQK